MDTAKINERYSELAESSCCLSCGGSLDLAEPREGEVCIDLGSGRGTDVIRMAEITGEKGFAYGIDVSEGMIKKAMNNAKKLDIQNVNFVRSDLEKINLKSSLADLVISNCTINHAADKKAVWSEIYRLLKPKGRFVVSDIYALDDVPDEYKNDPQAVAECWAGAVTREDYLQTLEETGFIKIEILEESQPYDKGKIRVASFTIKGSKPCCC